MKASDEIYLAILPFMPDLQAMGKKGYEDNARQPPRYSPALKSRPKKASASSLNPLQTGIFRFFSASSTRHPLAASQCPKRYTLYPPLLLLPQNFSTVNPAWAECFLCLDETEKHGLYTSICHAFRPQHVTHIAINAPIRAMAGSNDGAGTTENITRSPDHLTPVHGDFGPASCQDPEANDGQPIEADLICAFWTSTLQNNGVSQVWAPRWTMFSRGNITEKARISHGRLPGLDGKLGVKFDVLDLYVGIGYFAFSYLGRPNVRTVWGWEINGWSVEGCKRGAELNGIAFDVIGVDKEGHVIETKLAEVVDKVCRNELRCVVFHGNNKHAAKVQKTVQCLLDQARSDHPLSLQHVNLGLLPTSRDGWSAAVECLDKKLGGWLHVHENTDVHQIEETGAEIVMLIEQLTTCHLGRGLVVRCAHIEQVKSYAPGVMHCVFDVEILPTT